MDNFQQEIYKTIEIIAEKQIKKLGYDRTKKGVVTLVDNDICKVKIDGDILTCKITLGTRVEVGDVVFVKFPENSGSEKYVEGVLSTSSPGEYLAMTPNQILRALRMVDGAGSGLDADLLNGLRADELVISSNKVIISGEDKDLDGVLSDLKKNVNYNVEIISTNGNIFKNGIISTTLIATVRKGKEDVTDTIDANKFSWTRISEDREGDVAWNVSHFGGTKQVRITGEDVQKRATFNCDILE